MILIPPNNQSAQLLDDEPLYARSGWQIPTENPPQRPLVEMRAAERIWQSQRRIITRSLSLYSYNCVGMIFSSRRKWIEIDYLYKILKEDGFRKIKQNEIVEGDIVVYKQKNAPTHVGLILAIERYNNADNIRVLSKWGRDPEFIHFLEDVPESFGHAVEFYTERLYYEE